MSKVIFICGKICSGKTYYANEIKLKENAVILSIDEVTYDLINNEQGQGYDDFATKVNNYLRKKAVEIIKAGTNVILDWGFWSKEDRREITNYFRNNNVEIEWHYIDIDDKKWHENIIKRNNMVLSGQGGSAFYVDEGLINKLMNKFEMPDIDDMDIVYRFVR